jgi:hypothetical protein
MKFTFYPHKKQKTNKQKQKNKNERKEKGKEKPLMDLTWVEVYFKKVMSKSPVVTGKLIR